MTKTFSLAMFHSIFSGLRVSPLAMFTVARQRRHLAKLDDHILKDIGLTYTQAAQEADRPFWDLPDQGRC